MRKRSHLRGPSEAVTWLEWRKNRAGGLAKPIAANLHRLQQLSRAERRSKRGSLAAREASGTPKYGLRWVSAMGGARGRVSSRTEVAVGPSKGMGQSNVCHPHVGMCSEQSRKKCGSKGSIRPYIHSLDLKFNFNCWKVGERRTAKTELGARTRLRCPPATHLS